MTCGAINSGNQTLNLVGLGINVVMSLSRPFNAVSPMQPGVKPLGRVRRCHLMNEHVAGFIEEGPCVFLAGKIAGLPTPVSPATRQATENLARIGFMPRARIAGCGPA